MRSDNELDKEETNKTGFLLLILLGVVIVVMAVFGFGFGLHYYINSDTAEDQAATAYYHVEKKDGAEYWFCDDEHCSMYLVISDDLQVMSSGHPQMTECNKHLFVEE